MSKNRRPLPQPRRFPSAAKRELTPPGPACQQLFFKPRSFFSRRALRISPRRKSGNLSRLLLAVNNFFPFFQKNRHQAFTATTQQLQVVFNSQLKHLYILPQTPPSVNHFLTFFQNIFFPVSNLFVLLHYENMRFRDDTQKKGPESGLSGPSHQVA